MDGLLAPRLRTALERFGKPWYRLRAVRVFRDDSELTNNPGLWSSLCAVLDTSEYFVLLASPAAAQSEWIRRELSYWLERNGAARLLVVLTAGEIAWDHERSDFDWERSTALPPLLAGVLHEVPRYTDMRFARGEEQLSLRDPRFRDAAADIAAAIQRKDKAQLIGEEVRQHRRTMRLARGAAALLATLTVAAVALGLIALDRAHRATHEAQVARAQARLALSRSLTTDAGVALGRDDDLAALLAIEAERTDDTPAARSMSLRVLGVIERLQRTLRGHRAAVEAVAAGEHVVASGDSGGVVRLWHPRTGAPIAVLRGHQDVYAVAVRPDQGEVAAAGQDGAIRLWSVASGERIGAPLRGPQQIVWALAYSPDGRLLAAAGDDTVVLWDLARARRIGRAMTGARGTVGAVAFSPNGRMIASGGDNGDIRLWDVGSRRMIDSPLRGHHQAVGAVAFDPKGKTLVSGSDDGTVRFWNVDTGRAKGSVLRAGGPVLDVAASQRAVAAAVGDRIRLWDSRTRRPLGPALVGHSNTVNAVSFLPSGQTLASGSDDGTVRIFSVSHPLSRGLSSHPSAGLSFADHGRVLASIDGDGSLRAWSITTLGADVRRRRARALERALDPSATPSVSATADGEMIVWSAFDGARVWRGVPRAPRATRFGPDALAPDTVALSPNGRKLATADLDTIDVWDVTTGAHLRTVARDLTSSVQVLAFSPDGTTLAAGADDGTLRIFGLGSTQRPTVRMRHEGAPIWTLAFSPDARTLVAGGDDRVVRLLSADGRSLGAPLSGHGSRVTAAAFTDDGRTLATGDIDGIVRLWNMRARQPLGGPLQSQAGAVDGIAFTPDNRRLASGGARGVRLWSSLWWGADREALRQALCRRVGRELTSGEWHQFLFGADYRRTC